MSLPDTDDPGPLLDLARSGDGSALGRLLENYGTYLGLLARVQIGRRLQGKLDAADVLQETFMIASRDFGQFRGGSEGEFVAWLRCILGGVIANQVRRYLGTKGRDVRLEQELTGDVDRSSRALDRALVARQSTPSQRASRREQSVLLAAALARLPQDYREVIILRQLEELSFPEVAARMGRTEDSVKNLWARALGKLRRSLGDES
jgi:RNA polymerase sigma-70 factor (ECF subfamily)